MKILIVKLSALGDIVHAMVVLPFIKNKYPDYSIDWVVDSRCREILEHNPYLNQIHSIQLKNQPLIQRLKEFKKLQDIGCYDIVFDMQGLIKSAIVTKMINSDRTVGFDKHSIREKLASYFYHQKVHIGYQENIIKRNITLINESLKMNVQLTDIAHKPKLLFNQSHNFDELLSKEKNNIMIVIGASFQSKIYHYQKYAKIIHQIDANFIIIWGNEKERELAVKLKKLAPQSTLSRPLSIDELKDLIAQMDLVIGGDTGPTHMAWASNKKSIILFGPTPHHRNTLTSKNNIALSAIKKTTTDNIDRHTNMINNIKPDEIINAINKLIY